MRYDVKLRFVILSFFNAVGFVCLFVFQMLSRLFAPSMSLFVFCCFVPWINYEKGFACFTFDNLESSWKVRIWKTKKLVETILCSFCVATLNECSSFFFFFSSFFFFFFFFYFFIWSCCRVPMSKLLKPAKQQSSFWIGYFQGDNNSLIRWFANQTRILVYSTEWNPTQATRESRLWI